MQGWLCSPSQLLAAAAICPEALCKAAGRCEHKLRLFFLLCTEFFFPGPDDNSWSKYEDTLSESHYGSEEEEEEEEESMEAPNTCELEAQSFTECCAEWQRGS